ncbi:MhpC Predicted hydrolases or acyltransferases (alpha/beta hydrolase superfamily) [Fimbriimonadaceae bacterium]
MFVDDQLEQFESVGVPALLEGAAVRIVESAEANVWAASWGEGPAVVLLHGGLGHSGNWGYQVPVLLESGYRVITIDTRGHGRSTMDERPLTYHLLAKDVLAVLDELNVDRAALVGWSDGACTALVLAQMHPGRVQGVFFFACNMDPSGTIELTEFGPALQRCFARHQSDFAALSPNPEGWEALNDATGLMQKTEPNFSAAELNAITARVTVVLGENDEFIKREHMEYLHRELPSSELIILPHVSHFAPWQRPEAFNQTLLQFLKNGRS